MLCRVRIIAQRLCSSSLSIFFFTVSVSLYHRCCSSRSLLLFIVLVPVHCLGFSDSLRCQYFSSPSLFLFTSSVLLHLQCSSSRACSSLYISDELAAACSVYGKFSHASYGSWDGMKIFHRQFVSPCKITCDPLTQSKNMVPILCIRCQALSAYQISHPFHPPHSGHFLYPRNSSVDSFHSSSCRVSPKISGAVQTSLVARPPISFDLCKERLHKRLKHHGIEITKLMDEELCYIPMGGALPKLNQVLSGEADTCCACMHIPIPLLSTSWVQHAACDISRWPLDVYGCLK